MTTTHDAIIIGTGQAGPSLAQPAGRGRHEGRDHRAATFGGTCVNTGCIPTKAHGGERLRGAHGPPRARNSASHVGGAVGVDMARVKARKDAISGQSRDGVEKWLTGMEQLHGLSAATRDSIGPREVASAASVLTAAAHLHQRRRPRRRAGDAGRRRRSPYPHQQLDDGRRLPAASI